VQNSVLSATASYFATQRCLLLRRLAAVCMTSLWLAVGR
jgi:hypothetical protein